MSSIRTESLGTEKIGKLLYKLSVPTIAAQIINVLYNMVDRIYIGHIPEVGTTALTGVGVTFPIIMIISAFASLISAGGAPRISISLGKNDKETANKILGNSFVALLLISITLTIVILSFSEPMLMMFGASNDTISYALDYINIYAIGTIFVQLTLGLNVFITAQGFTKISMMSVVFGAGLNIILDPIFIFIFGLGVKGAAIATIISQAVSCIWVLSFLLGDATSVKLNKKYFGLDKNILLPCIALGVSPFIMQSTESLLAIAFNSSLKEYGGDIAVGAMVILTSAQQLMMLPLLGLTQGASPIISYNYGANKIDRVKLTIKYAMIICAIYTILYWVVCQTFPHIFLKLFNFDSNYIDFGSTSLRIYMAGSFIMGIFMMCQQAFVALGNAKYSMFVAILRKFILLIPLIYILPNFIDNKTNAVFLAEPTSDIIAGVVATLLFIKYMRKINNHTQDNI